MGNSRARTLSFSIVQLSRSVLCLLHFPAPLSLFSHTVCLSLSPTYLKPASSCFSGIRIDGPRLGLQGFEGKLPHQKAFSFVFIFLRTLIRSLLLSDSLPLRVLADPLIKCAGDHGWLIS